MTIIRSFGAVGIAEIEGEEEAVVSIGEMAGIDHLDVRYLVLFDMEDVNAVRIAFEVQTVNKGER